MYNALSPLFIPGMRRGPVSVGHPSSGHGLVRLCVCLVRVCTCLYVSVVVLFVRHLLYMRAHRRKGLVPTERFHFFFDKIVDDIV